MRVERPMLGGDLGYCRPFRECTVWFFLLTLSTQLATAGSRMNLRQTGRAATTGEDWTCAGDPIESAATRTRHVSGRFSAKSRSKRMLVLYINPTRSVTSAG